MKFKLTLIASKDDGVAFITEVEATVPANALDGEGTLGGALAVILENLREKGIGIS